MKKIIALVLSLALILMACGSAFAAEGDTTLTVTGLTGATSVSYYKIIDWDDTTGWKWASPYSGNAACTAELLKEITGDPGKPAVQADPEHNIEGSEAVAPVAGKITSSTADIIASISNTSKLTGGSLSNGTWSATVGKDDRGMYMVVPTGSGDVLFNPIFISANHGVASQTVDVSSNYQDGNTNGMSKKSTINVNKLTDKHTFQGYEGYKWEGHQPGDEITFWVETTIPKFADSYTDPVFKVTDNASTGMNIQTTSLKVYTGTKASKGTDLTKGDSATAGDYDVSFTTSDSITSAFVVNFHKGYFDNMVTNQPVVIEYKATITNAAPITVNEENNLVKVDFSNSPDDTTGNGHKHDKTKHWTFSIDATILGNSEYHTSELVKIGVNPDGTEKTATHTYSNTTTAAPLAGATFQLKQGDKVVREITTAADGYIHFEGLDVGEYQLIETQAPAGYVKDNGTYTVKITATVTEDADTETLDDGCVVNVDHLDSYSVEVTTPSGEKATSSYTFNAGTIKQTVVNDITTKVANTPGAELPSTGGIGTTIFYILGGLLVIGAAVVLVARRKAHD